MSNFGLPSAAVVGTCGHTTKQNNLPFRRQGTSDSTQISSHMRLPCSQILIFPFSAHHLRTISRPPQTLLESAQASRARRVAEITAGQKDDTLKGWESSKSSFQRQRRLKKSVKCYFPHFLLRSEIKMAVERKDFFLQQPRRLHINTRPSETNKQIVISRI